MAVVGCWRLTHGPCGRCACWWPHHVLGKQCVTLCAIACACVRLCASRVSATKDDLLPNAAVFQFLREDHTLGNLIRMCVRRGGGATHTVALLIGAPWLLQAAALSTHGPAGGKGGREG